MKKQYAKWFNEMSIRMDQSNKDGRTIVSCKTMSFVLKTISELCEELEQKDKDVPPKQRAVKSLLVD